MSLLIYILFDFTPDKNAFQSKTGYRFVLDE